jgi:hypothetical protein
VIKYKIVSSTEKQYENIEIPLMLETELGSECSVLGGTFTVTQSGGGIIILSNKDWVMTLQEIYEAPKEPVVTFIDDPKYLRINKEVDLFFDTLEIRLNIGHGYLTEEHGLTYASLYKFLMNEWKTIANLFPENKALPMEHEPGTNNYCLINGWNWFADYTLLLKDGCWSRKDLMGRHI